MSDLRIMFNEGLDDRSFGYISIHGLAPGILSQIGKGGSHEESLHDALRVSVLGNSTLGIHDLPGVCGKFQVFDREVHFRPIFPFEPGLNYNARFDPRHVGISEDIEPVALDFSTNAPQIGDAPAIDSVFPSSDCLPDNLLRFYIKFTEPMARGQAEAHVRLLDDEGRVVPDVFYRPPVELWDKSFRHLTILLDPGRLKRFVGPNRELGQPLTNGSRYVLKIDAGMRDARGNVVPHGLNKRFQVTSPIRVPLSVAKWEVRSPLAGTMQPLEIIFPYSLDWGMLWRSISITSPDQDLVDGRVGIADHETVWRFVPSVPWRAGKYTIRVKSDLEDVSGNNLFGAFDRPIRSCLSVRDRPSETIVFCVKTGRIDAMQ